MGLFIPHNKLENLKLYKYSSEDHSAVSKYVLKHWWNYFVKIFPLSMAPNVVTLMGLGFILLNLACVFYYDPYLEGDAPRWCYFFYAFGLFMYQTFDGCDGCHARRTGQSGPLGELFDHSIDAINSSLGAFVFASVLKMGYGGMFMLSQFATVCNFYTSTWEEYHTHTLYLSEFSGPVEGVLMICGVYVITGIFGPDMWSIRLGTVNLGAIGAGSYEIDSSAFYVVIGLASIYFNIRAAMNNVNNYYEKKYKTNQVKARKFTDDAYQGLSPFFIYYSTIVLLAWTYPEMIFDHGFSTVLSICFTIAFSVGRIIIAHLTVQDFPMIQIPMFLPVLQLGICKFLISIYGYDRGNVLTAVSWLGLGATFGIHSTFIAEIIYEITTYLDIYTLSIKHKRA